jgi:hypothetical protein
MMHSWLIPSIVTLVLVLSCTPCSATVDVTLKPVRFCADKATFRCRKFAYPFGKFWENAGVRGNKQDNIFLSVMSPPTKRDIEYIVFLSSGQQGLTGRGQGSNVVSGAPSDYRWNTNENCCKKITLNPKSIAAQMYQNKDGKYWPRKKTLAITIFNNQFNFLTSKSQKDKVLAGYADFLDSLVEWNNIKGIHLGGASRGACLAMRLAQELPKKFNLKSTKFIINSVDGVCKATQHEFGVQLRDPIKNSHVDARHTYQAYRTDLNKQFPASMRQNLCIRHVLGGEDVTKVGLGVRAFSHTSCDTNETTCALKLPGDSDFAWYTQQWTPHCHQCLGRDYALEDYTVIPALKHFEMCREHFHI